MTSIERRIDALESKAPHVGGERVDLIVKTVLTADHREPVLNYFWSTGSGRGTLNYGYIKRRDDESQDAFRERGYATFRGTTPGAIGSCAATEDADGMPSDLPNLDLQSAGA